MIAYINVLDYIFLQISNDEITWWNNKKQTLSHCKQQESWGKIHQQLFSESGQQAAHGYDPS